MKNKLKMAGNNSASTLIAYIRINYYLVESRSFLHSLRLCTFSFSPLVIFFSFEIDVVAIDLFCLLYLKIYFGSIYWNKTRLCSKLLND